MTVAIRGGNAAVRGATGSGIGAGGDAAGGAEARVGIAGAMKVGDGVAGLGRESVGVDAGG